MRKLPLLLVVAVLAAGGYLLFRDTTPPTLTIGPDAAVVTLGTEFVVTAADGQSGLGSLVIEIAQGDMVRKRIEKTFVERTLSHTESLHLDADMFQDGPVTITATCADSSLYFFGEPTVLHAQYVIDSKKPVISVIPMPLNLNQGGSGLVKYTLSEKVSRTGILVGKDFFPGYLQENGSYLCLFAMAHDLSPEEFQPRLLAVDLAGNEGTASLSYHANARKFKNDRINLPLSFLKRKSSLFEREFPGDPETDLLGRYLKINNKLRRKNRARLKDIGLLTSAQLRISGAMYRHPGSPTAGFAENRDYFFEGVPVDNQTHLGVDIASVKNAPVLAAENGTVVLAEFYGIYGNCVVVDHGLGLQTLYSHLSQISVTKGQKVTKKELLGKTGVTGLAGGDHLHFGVLISGVPVHPKEWWDATWIRNNILSKLQ